MSRHPLLSLLLCAATACTCPPCAEPRPAAAAAKRKAPVTYPLLDRELELADVDRLIWRPGVDATFAATTPGERAALTRLVPALLAGARRATPPDPAGWEADAHAVGFRVERWHLGGETYWALVELPERRRGAGAYVFRVAPAPAAPGEADPEILLEAPHAYHDVGTGMLAAQLFFAPGDGPRPRALFTNTIHRYQLAPGQKVKRKDSPADVAHAPEHGFTAATVAFATALPHVLVLQLHGFASLDEDDDGGDARATADVSLVVSAADRRGSSRRSTAIAAALARAFGPGVRRFPEDVAVLGATTNVQARRLREVPGAELVHLELSAELRKQLRADEAARASFGAAIFGGGATP